MKELQGFTYLCTHPPKAIHEIKNLFNGGRLLWQDSNKEDRLLIQIAIRQLVPFLGGLMQETLLNDNISHAKQIYTMTRDVLEFLAPHYFEEYLKFLEFDREPEKKFYLPREKQLSIVTDAMQDLEDDKLDLLCVSMPPGTGKTTLGTFFLSWIMGKHPDGSNLASGHSDKLTTSFYEGVNIIISDPEYNYPEVFPDITIQGLSAKNTTINFNNLARFKTLTCRSIDGSLTGVTRCENYLYADDLVSGIEVALSIERLDKLWQTYTDNLKSRKLNFAKELHIATRWSVHDTIGKLERLKADNPRAKFISIPALDDNNESNFDYPFGVGFDTKYFNDMRTTMDDVSWKALYMNEPVEREGLLLSLEELNWYSQLPEGPPDGVFASCDPSLGKGDDTVMPVGYMYGDNVFVEDAICNGALPDVTQPMCANMIIRHKVGLAQFESNASGWSFADSVGNLVAKSTHKATITKKNNQTNKQTRIIMAVPHIKANFYFKNPDGHKNPQYARYIRKLTSYSATGRNKHDDAPDATAQLSELIRRLTTVAVTAFKRPF